MRREQLTGHSEPPQVPKVQDHGGVQVFQSAVDIVLALLEGVQDSSMMDDRLVQTRNIGPQTGHMLVEP